MRESTSSEPSGPLQTNPTINPIVRLAGVGKVFFTDQVETHALSGIDLEVAQGEFLSISGPSGSGKSTLLSIMGLLDTPSTGQCWLGGQNTDTLSLRERARLRSRTIGFVFQSFHLIADLTVFQNVELPLTYRRIPRGERRRQVHEVLGRVSMDHRAEHYPSQLSGGQQQRVSVARALVCRPSLLLADEPTGNLDSHSGEAVMGLLSDIHDQGSTICMVSHDPRYADCGSRVISLFDGRMAGRKDSIEKGS